MNYAKKIGIGLAGICLGLFTYAGVASAASYCLDATIDGIGVRPSLATATRSQYIVFMTCNDTPVKWSGSQMYYLTVDQGDSGYATVLTASSLAKNIKVKLTSFTEFSLIENIDMNTN